MFVSAAEAIREDACRAVQQLRAKLCDAVYQAEFVASGQPARRAAHAAVYAYADALKIVLRQTGPVPRVDGALRGEAEARVFLRGQASRLLGPVPAEARS